MTMTTKYSIQMKYEWPFKLKLENIPLSDISYHLSVFSLTGFAFTVALFIIHH